MLRPCAMFLVRTFRWLSSPIWYSPIVSWFSKIFDFEIKFRKKITWFYQPISNFHWDLNEISAKRENSKNPNNKDVRKSALSLLSELAQGLNSLGIICNSWKSRDNFIKIFSWESLDNFRNFRKCEFSLRKFTSIHLLLPKLTSTSNWRQFNELLKQIFYKT